MNVVSSVQRTGPTWWKEIARDGLEEHRIARRANAVLLLDKGWSFAEVAEAFYIDDVTVRAWLKVTLPGR